MSIEFEREEDGRWLADVPEPPGVLPYGASASRFPLHQSDGEKPMKRRFVVAALVMNYA